MWTESVVRPHLVIDSALPIGDLAHNQELPDDQAEDIAELKIDLALYLVN